jgi:hypothetical protein
MSSIDTHEDAMTSQKQDRSMTEPGEARWILLRIDRSSSTALSRSSDAANGVSESGDLNNESSSPTADLFRHIAHMTLAERYPVLTCFAVALGLLASAVVTEIECLRGSGYFWQ